MSDEWGPWIEHDGSGCPCIGQWVHVRTDAPCMGTTNQTATLLAGGWEAIGIASGSEVWFRGALFTCVVRYRVKRPDAMKVIDVILADVDQRERVPS